MKHAPEHYEEIKQLLNKHLDAAMQEATDNEVCGTCLLTELLMVAITNLMAQFGPMGIAVLLQGILDDAQHALQTDQYNIKNYKKGVDKHH